MAKDLISLGTKGGSPVKGPTPLMHVQGAEQEPSCHKNATPPTVLC